MTPEMTWDKIEIDQVKPISLFEVWNSDGLKEAISWKTPQPLFKKIHSHKGPKFNFLDYQLHFFKAYQFMKLKDEEGLNQDTFRRSIQ